ncbi:PREDICTED: uncharacterized protein LOC105558574 isoform X2 [Vollenhovia emeryi]|uniref:uncharacterized protein LOC105558574 isoform X2 n=1 Tax=Vollenhovia emeryi TaxID=411798 RepID=UPI0005F46DC2|nr:PREDICTED: uncharacterized protein LOC105558574 isoform X2 [Vollenhovia emeryi]
MKNVHFPIESFETVFPEENVFKEETIASQATLQSIQRSLPNILRSNNARTSRSCKTLSKIDATFVSSVEDGNTSLELNSSSSIDLDMEANYNKNESPKPHHKRKQVHNLLNVRYDIPDCNNNKNKNALPTFDQLTASLRASPGECKESVPTKRVKCNNKQKKLNKKSKKSTARKSGREPRTSRKKPDPLATIPEIVNMNNTVVMQTANNFLESDICIQPSCNSNFPSVNVTDLHDSATPLVEPNTLYYNNEIYSVERKKDIYLNHVISNQPTEFDTALRKTTQRDLTSYEFPITENNLQQDRDIGYNFLPTSKILYSCSCANCMSNDKDIIFYEAPVSPSTNSDDLEAELFKCDMDTNIFDFYNNNYFQIFENNSMDFEQTNLYYQEFDENSIKKENGTKSTTELIESSANVSSIEQNQSQNSQPCHIDEIQDCVGSRLTELVTYPNGRVRVENARVYDDRDISNYLNLENFSMKGEEINTKNEAQIQTDVPVANSASTDVPVSNFKRQTPENKTDLCVIQCSECGKLFNKKHQLWKHYKTHCNFYNEHFKCHICDKIYRHRSSLSQHLRIAHKVSFGVHNRFYCNKCPKSYVRYRAFQRHMLLHDD